MTTIYLDIETIPGQAAHVRQQLEAQAIKEKEGLSAPANYKDPVKIEEYLAGKRAEIDAAADERWRRTAMDGLYGQLYCAAIAVDDADPVAICYDDERTMLEALYSDIREAANMRGRDARPTFVGHNIIGFDLQFLFQRSVILGVRPPLILPFAAKPWDDFVFDTMTRWAGMRNFISMDKLAAALGAPPKGEIDGSKVWDFVRDGRGKEVVQYCCDDVIRTRILHKRMTWADQLAA